MGDDDLVALLSVREVREARVRDFFDLADSLLDFANVQKILATLDRTTLAAISAVGIMATDATGPTTAEVATWIEALEPDETVVEQSLRLAVTLALLDDADGTWLPYLPVSDQLARWPAEGMPSFRELISDPVPTTLTPVAQVDSGAIDHIAAEHAFNATNSIAALLAELQHEPARELARGGIALPETKRLATAMAVQLDDVATLVDIAARAELAALDAGNWLPTEAAVDWMLQSGGERWAHLADAWFGRLPGDIRDLLSSRAGAAWGDRLAEYVRWLYPAGGDWMRERAQEYIRDAQVLGIIANQTISGPGGTLMSKGADAAASAMAALFPPEIDKVYLQHDLTIVAPGPLLPKLDARLRTMADVESRALASTYRVSEASINRALTTGETADTVREFLAGISLTGIPQPLEYLIVGAAARFGSLRVGRITQSSIIANQPGAKSYVSAEDATQLSAILVDHGLTALGFTRVGPYRAVSRFDFEVVFWSLSEARYPVAAEDENGRIVLLERRRIARPVTAPQESPAQVIVRRLRAVTETTPAETGQAWLERQIDTAIRAKIGLTVTVAMPDGSSVDLQLEPASLAGGRLRARDRRSDLERTLPLSSITAVGPAAE
jgi:hypothetical protein